MRDNHNGEAHATISLILDTAPLRHYDLSVGAIEVTQAVQPMTLPEFGSSVSAPTPGISISYRTGHYTGVLLASGKTTIARVFPDATGLPFGFHIDARLYGYRASDAPPFTSVPLPGNYVRPLGGPVAYNPDYSGVDRERGTGRNALTFNLPADWTSHPGVTIRLVAQLIPEPDSTTLGENSTENNIAGIDGVDFFPMQSVTFSPIEQFVHLTAPTPHDDHPPANPVPLFDATRAMLPVADSAFTVQAPYLASFNVTGVAGVGPFDPDQLLVQLLDAWYNGGRCGGAHCTGQPIAVIPGGGVPVDHSYTVPWPIVAPWASVVEADRPYTAIAHEIGHLLGRAHASGSCGAGGFLGVLAEGWSPDDRGYLQGIGVDPQAADMVGPGSYRIIAQGFDGQPHDYDYMSYCNGQRNGGDNCYEACSWVSPKGWTELFNSLDALHHRVPPLPHDAADRTRPVPSLRVLAAVRPGGAVTIISVRPGKRVPGSPSPGKLFRLIGENRAGRRITSVAMSQAYAHLDRHASVLTVTATIPARAVSKLAILSTGTLAATRSRPAPIPAVGWNDLRAIAKLPGRGKVVLHWRAKARSSGPPLESLIEYSADGGTHYRPIAATLSNSIAVPAAMFARSSNARLRLRVNDGFDVVSVTSPRLAAAGTPPHVTLISPSAKTRSSRAATLELVGQAVDDQLRTLKGRQLRWYAGRRLIATGASASVANLPGATVVIRLVARDRSGRTASASVRIHLFTPLKIP